MKNPIPPPMPAQGPVARAIAAKLTAALAPTFLEIADHSHRHVGHAQQKTSAGHAQNASETHFSVTIVSAAFDGKSRLDRHRQVTTALAEELAGPVHALSLRCLAPSEN